MATKQRLDKVLAHVGIGTRKDIKKWIRAERIFVNGRPATDSGMHVIPDVDIITVDGEEIQYREYVYLMMNKPAGVLSATFDDRDPVVVDLLSDDLAVFEPFPVGRLDKDTEGLLLLTNDGKLSHRLLSPKRHVPKLYFAEIDGVVTTDDAVAFERGVELEDGYVTMPGHLTIHSSGPQSTIELTIYEGKFHQVKRMFQAVGKRVTYLKRMKMGPIQLDPALQLGDYRELTADELGALREAVGQAEE